MRARQPRSQCVVLSLRYLQRILRPTTWSKYFHPEELKLFAKQRFALQHLAPRYAAKMALRRLYPQQLRHLNRVAILRPQQHATVQYLPKALAARRLLFSLSCDRDYAGALLVET